jgi:hypothetical protein
MVSILTRSSRLLTCVVMYQYWRMQRALRIVLTYILELAISIIGDLPFGHDQTYVSIGTGYLLGSTRPLPITTPSILSAILQRLLCVEWFVLALSSCAEVKLGSSNSDAALSTLVRSARENLSLGLLSIVLTYERWSLCTRISFDPRMRHLR